MFWWQLLCRHDRLNILASFMCVCCWHWWMSCVSKYMYIFNNSAVTETKELSHIFLFPEALSEFLLIHLKKFHLNRCYCSCCCYCWCFETSCLLACPNSTKQKAERGGAIYNSVRMLRHLIGLLSLFRQNMLYYREILCQGLWPSLVVVVFFVRCCLLVFCSLSPYYWFISIPYKYLLVYVNLCHNGKKRTRQNLRQMWR